MFKGVFPVLYIRIYLIQVLPVTLPFIMQIIPDAKLHP